MMSSIADQRTFLSVVHATDDFPYGQAANEYYSLYLPNDDQPHGLLLPEVVAKMPWTKKFILHHDYPRSVTVVDDSHGKNSAAAVNLALQEVVDICVDKKLFHVLNGQHSELFAIAGARYEEVVKLERFATPLFGITTRGAHLVCYTNADQGIKLWIPRRAPHLYICPNMLDSTVAGGVKSGVAPFQTIVEEADEEASLPEDLIRKYAKCRGVVSHMSVTGSLFPGEKGLVCPDYVYVYDIELPSDVIPRPHDDEVGEFYSMTIDEVQRAMLNSEFKPDSAAVIVEFMIRHGFITPENEPHFVEINMRLHRMLPFRTG